MEFPTIEAIEAIGTGAMSFSAGGQRYVLPEPGDMTVMEILNVLHAEWLPQTPTGLPTWKGWALFKRWRAWHDLPDIQQAQRLLFVVERYRNEIEIDIRSLHGEDLTTLFKTRRWRLLLNLIDRLPGASWYAEAVSNNEEHAAALAKNMAESGAGEGKAPPPPLRIWSHDTGLLADMVDAIRNVNHTLVAVNSEKGKVPAPPERTPRPETALSRAQRVATHERKKTAHEKLVARILPHKAKSGD